MPCLAVPQHSRPPRLFTTSHAHVRLDASLTATLSRSTLVTWENDGHTLVSTMTTTAAEGYFTSGWTATTRIEHTLEDGELVIKTIAPEGTYLMWMERSKA